MNGFRASLAGIIAAVLISPALGQTDAQSPAPAVDAAAEADEAQLLGGVAAIVNDQVISLSDVAQRARLLLITLGVSASQENLQQALPRALEDLIDERLQLQKAGEFDVKISDADITSAVQDVAAQNQSTIEDLYNTLQSNGVNPETLQEQMRAEIAWRRIMSGLYGSRIRISQLQIDSMLDRLSADASKERYQLSEIFLYAPTEADKNQALQGAGVIVEQLRQGARFQLAAQQYSNSPTAAVGGDLGWVSPAELPAEAQAVLKDATPPILTTPIVVDDGVYIYAFKGKQDGFTGAKDVSLKQILASDSNRAKLNALSLEAPTCDSVEDTVSSDDTLIYADLGRVPEDILTDEIRAAIQNVPEGQASDILDTPAGPALLFVCDRAETGAQIPSRAQVEDRLFSQQIALQSQRELRDLKREATIIRR